MKRSLVLLICLILLSSCPLAARLSETEVKASNNYPVHNLNTGKNYATIQEAINANETLDKHVILVDAGVYYERITINKSISLVGTDKETTIVDGNRTEFYRGSDSVIYVTANGVSVSNFTIQNSGGDTYWHLEGGICLSSNDNRITNNIIRANNFGLEIGDPYTTSVSNNIIRANIVAGNNYGIFQYAGMNNCIINNTVKANSMGIWFIGLDPSGNNTVSENLVSENDNGISLDDFIVIGGQASLTAIADNSAQAICSSDSLNRISRNTINRNNIGISIASGNNVVEGNIIEQNTCGISFYDAPEPASSNHIYWNNWIRNTDQAAISNLVPNNWDNGIEGNYWSDYDGTDANHDGIGDTPYAIDENNTDNYPLMGVFSDFSVATDQRITTVSNSTISDFRFNGTAIIFSVTGVEGTAGFCRIRIPTSLMNATYRVFINGTEITCNLLPCSNTTHRYIYFSYTHSTKTVIVVPESSTLTMLPLFTVGTILAVTAFRRKHPKRTRIQLGQC